MVTRVYKRVAMSKGGFSGKGIFATLSYLVVEFDGGQKVCNFKYEQQVDDFLSVIRAEHPSIPCVSAAAEQRIAEEKARREEEERNRPPMSAQAEKTVQALDNAIDYLERRPELAERLSAAAKRRRNFQCTNGSYRWAAMAITLLGFAALAYGIVSFVSHGSLSIYFTLFGLAAIFTFAGFSVLPTARAVMDGRAVTAAQALDVVKADLKALNADVTVSQEEYDEVVAIKSMFLNAEYQ